MFSSMSISDCHTNSWFRSATHYSIGWHIFLLALFIQLFYQLENSWKKIRALKFNWLIQIRFFHYLLDKYSKFKSTDILFIRFFLMSIGFIYRCTCSSVAHEKQSFQHASSCCNLVVFLLIFILILIISTQNFI